MRCDLCSHARTAAQGNTSCLTHEIYLKNHLPAGGGQSGGQGGSAGTGEAAAGQGCRGGHAAAAGGAQADPARWVLCLHHLKQAPQWRLAVPVLQLPQALHRLALPADVIHTLLPLSRRIRAQLLGDYTAFALSRLLLLLQGSWCSGRPCLPAHSPAPGATIQL